MQMVPWTPLTPTEPLLRNAVAGGMMFSELGSNRQARFCWRSETQPMLYGARPWCLWHIIEVHRSEGETGDESCAIYPGPVVPQKTHRTSVSIVDDGNVILGDRWKKRSRSLSPSSQLQ